MVYAETHSEYQRVMRWQLILEELRPNIQHAAEDENILADTLSILPSTTIERDKLSTPRALSTANKLFTTRLVQLLRVGIP